MDEHFMRMAIAEAMKSSEPLKCGAVIVNDGHVVSKACNSQRSLNDASAHAEINAIREAGRKTGSKDLKKCIIYCTCEPCIMCLTAIAFSKIRKIVYGLQLKDVLSKEKLIDIDIERFLSLLPYKIEVVKNFMKDECLSLLH